MSRQRNGLYYDARMFADPGSDAELAVAAAQAGAAVVLGRYETALTRFGKPGGDFATDADLAAEYAVIEVIKAARPSDAMTGEERGSAGEDDADRRWLCDLLGVLREGEAPLHAAGRGSGGSESRRP